MPSRPTRRAARSTVAALLLTLAACRRPAPASDLAFDNTPGDVRVTPPAGPRTLDDADLATLAAQLNGAEVSAAGAALAKAQNAGVRQFAADMRREHLALNAQLDAAVNRDTLSRPPAEFATLEASSKGVADLLNAMPVGPAFDRTYLAAQEVDHQKALDSLRVWQAQARDGALRSALGAAVPRVQAHLARVRTLQGTLGGGLAAGPVAPPPDSLYAGPAAQAQFDSLRPLSRRDTARSDAAHRDSVRRTTGRRP